MLRTNIHAVSGIDLTPRPACQTQIELCREFVARVRNLQSTDQFRLLKSNLLGMLIFETVIHKIKIRNMPRSKTKENDQLTR